jgi:hypothetical protein
MKIGLKNILWAYLKAIFVGCLIGLFILANAIYSCINGDTTANIFFRELAYATHAATRPTPPKTVIASPSKPKPKKSKKVKLCFADNDGVQQCK